MALGTHPYLGIFVGLASALTVFVISTSYSQIIELFPTGGGGYLPDDKYKLRVGDRVSFQILEDRRAPNLLMVADSGERVTLQ